MKKFITFVTVTLIMLTVISCNWNLEDQIPKGMGRVTVSLPVIGSKSAKSIFTCMDQTTHYIVTVFSPTIQKSEQISSSQTSVKFDLYPGDYTVVVYATNEYFSSETESYNYITGSALHRTSIREGKISTLSTTIYQIAYSAVVNMLNSTDTDDEIYCYAVNIDSNFSTGIPEIKLSGNISGRMTYTIIDDNREGSTILVPLNYNSGLAANSTLENISFTKILQNDRPEEGTEIRLDLYPENFMGNIDGTDLHELHPDDKNYKFYPPPEKFSGKVNNYSTSMYPEIGIDMTGDYADIDNYEEDDTFYDAESLILNETQLHNFVDDNVDWVTIEVEKGYLYTFETTVSGTADTIITLFDSEMVQMAYDDDGGAGSASQIDYIFTTSGTFYLNITPYSATDANSAYTISAKRILAPQPEDLQLPMDSKKWTILVYLDADNNLKDFGDLDIAEMAGVGSTDSVNIVVLWDNMNIKHGYYYIEKGKAMFAKELGEVNMGDESTAIDFIDWAVDNFPADHYMFDYWNHGGAVDRSGETTPRGIAWDDTNGDDWLSETEQKNIIKFFKDKINRPIDIVSYDACLMATAEIAYLYNGYANYLVASEETEPGDGWDYNFLETVAGNPDISAATLANNILTFYMNSYDSTKNLTFSVADLSYIDGFAIALDTFCTAALATKNGPLFNSYTKNVADFSDYTKDLYGYMKNVVDSDNPDITIEIKEYAEKIMTIIKDNLIIFEDHGSNWTDKAYGLSITMKADTNTYSLLDICKDTSWDEFLTFCGFSN